MWGREVQEVRRRTGRGEEEERAGREEKGEREEKGTHRTQMVGKERGRSQAVGGWKMKGRELCWRVKARGNGNRRLGRVS